MAGKFVIGLDVGTGSVRAGVFDLAGRMLAHASREIELWKPRPGYVEQSSENIWRCACESVREAVEQAGVGPEDVSGISFDATCSLVALGPDDSPVTVSPEGDPERNIIVWMDHRAVEQAGRINGRGHELLEYVGGVISPEMETPKLLWLKENLPGSWEKAARFLDLADFMTYRCTGVDTRSLCTTVCKWTYLGHEDSWDRGYFEQTGIADLLDRKMIGERVRPMGEPVGPLTPESARELGLTTATSVAVGIIDAHAGGIGLIGMDYEQSPEPEELESIVSLIGGTSSCHMAVSREPKYISGIWGPYYSAMVPGMWLTEGGQSATGALIDFVIADSPRADRLREEAGRQGKTVYELLNRMVARMKEEQGRGPELVKDINVLPYFIGNRSPNADPAARGVVSGLTLDDSPEFLARKYYATIQAIACGTRHIIEQMNASGYSIDRIYACGGGTKNPLWLQEHADITGCRIVLPAEPEAVLLGSAVLAAVGAGHFASITEASARMSSPGKTYEPDRSTAKFHDARYRVFRRMYEDFKAWRDELAEF